MTTVGAPLRARFRRRIPQAWRTPLGVTGAAVALAWVLVAVLGPALWPHDPLAQDFPRLEAPGGAHWFGTDELGRDVFTRVLAGARVTVPLAMLPVVTTIGLQAGLLFSGAVLTETVFAFNGVGQYLFQAIGSLDYPVLQGYILFIAVMYALINLLVDLTYGLIDPRVRVS